MRALSLIQNFFKTLIKIKYWIEYRHRCLLFYTLYEVEINMFIEINEIPDTIFSEKKNRLSVVRLIFDTQK